MITPDDKFTYEKLFWSVYLQESDVNEIPRIEYEMFRIKYFVEGIIKKHPDAEGIIDKFFKERGFDNYRSYVTPIVYSFLDFINSYTNDGVLKTGIMENEQIRKLFAPLVVNDTIPESYLILKSHPVYYFNGGYYVMNWNYLLSQIFVGTFMALKNELSINGFKDIKKDWGQIIEHTLFKDVLVKAFRNSWQCYAFDDESKGVPDAMFRIDNNLFILELKDNLMREDVMESFDYTYIEKYIKHNFIETENGKKKGIRQLCEYIKTYVNNGYEALGFPYNKKLNIYPIIIYTDYKYRLHGLNHYLSIKFDEIVSATEISVKRRIRPLTIIGLDTLFNLQFRFQKKELKLADKITKYHKYVKNKEKEDALKGVNKFSQLYPSFDRYLLESIYVLPFSEAELVLKDFFF